MRSIKYRLLTVALVLYLVLGPTLSFACGPFTLTAVFVFKSHPQSPLDGFAGGKIGVIQPSYARSYLYVGYRYLQGEAFTPSEQRMLTELWKERLDYGWEMGEDEWVKTWLDARKKVPGLSAPTDIRVYRNREEPNQYETYVNCQKDAFENAAATLNARLTKFGADSAAVKDWVAAQDQVFSNCGGGENIPSTTSDQDPTLRADREYQIAAANFYATHFDESIKRFDAIASDSTSPWRSVAPYLAVRSFVRKASLGPAESKSAPLAEAESRLNRIVADQKLSSMHAAASRLLDLVRLRLHPSERLHELATKLTAKRQNDSLKQDLWDYTVLLDAFLETSAAEKANFEKTSLSDDLTDWINNMQSSSPDSLNHSLSKWRTTHANTWLVSSLSKLRGTEPNSSELITAALKIDSTSPAFPSARFHAARLLIANGKSTDARTMLDDLLKNQRQQFEASTLNLLLGLRMSVATSLDDFLTHAARFPAALSWDEDGREIPADSSEISPEMKAAQGKQYFDLDATTVLNRRLPVSLLKEAAKNPALPVHLRRDIAQATWLRAVLVGDMKTADELVPTLKSLLPAIASQLNDFATNTEPAAKKFSAIFAWLKFPGLEPVVDSGLGRESALNERDSFRDNWWCSAAFVEPPPEAGIEEEDELPSFTAEKNQSATFLSPEQNAAAAREYSIITGLGAGPNYIARQVIEWVNANPKDPRAAEALHLGVTATRYGCTDTQTGRWSKAAFDLLHRNYPNTTWAKKTRYWFKD